MATILFMDEDSSCGVKKSRNLDPPGSKGGFDKFSKRGKAVNPMNYNSRNENGNNHSYLATTKERLLAFYFGCVLWLAFSLTIGNHSQRGFLGQHLNSAETKNEPTTKDPHHEEKNSDIYNKKKKNNNSNYSNDNIGRVCARIEASLDMKSWAPIQYHKDKPEGRRGTNRRMKLDKAWVDSVEEDDADGRATVEAFNRIKNSKHPVLKESLLDEGIRVGSEHRALQFLERMASSRDTNTPVNIAVFGNSFAIGANCVESTAHLNQHCAWPMRAKERMSELLSNSLGESDDVVIDWHMWQENAQASLVIANKIPAFVNSFRSRNQTVDAILIDTSMSDHGAPWFEAVLRALLKLYPNVVILSIIDGESNLVTPRDKSSADYVEWLRDVQETYQLTVVDMAKMVTVAREDDGEKAPDRLWPQTNNMTNYKGDQRDDVFMQKEMDVFIEQEMKYQGKGGMGYYWTNFVPKVRKKMDALYPSAHPPWPTHQYVADTVTQALLRTAHQACVLKRSNIDWKVPPTEIPEDTVARKKAVEACPICLEPLSSIDAKNPPRNDSGIVTPVCGDWKWITDDRNRAGWQSDEKGSLLRIRFTMGLVNPLVVMTYTGSYATFGDFRVTFRRPDQEPLLDCGALSQQKERIPSMKFSSHLQEYTLPKVATFPSKFDFRVAEEFKLLNATILSSMTNNSDNKSDIKGQKVDMYIENTGDNWKHRTKIQMITAC